MFKNENGVGRRDRGAEGQRKSGSMRPKALQRRVSLERERERRGAEIGGLRPRQLPHDSGENLQAGGGPANRVRRLRQKSGGEEGGFDKRPESEKN